MISFWKYCEQMSDKLGEVVVRDNIMDAYRYWQAKKSVSECSNVLRKNAGAEIRPLKKARYADMAQFAAMPAAMQAPMNNINIFAPGNNVNVNANGDEFDEEIVGP